MQSGVLAGYNVVDVKVILEDGSYHEVDSSEMAFKIAGSMAFKDAMKKAAPILMEPIMKVAVIIPEEYMGDVIGDLNSRRGMILGMRHVPVQRRSMRTSRCLPCSAMRRISDPRHRAAVSTPWSRAIMPRCRSLLPKASSAAAPSMNKCDLSVFLTKNTCIIMVDLVK